MNDVPRISSIAKVTILFKVFHEFSPVGGREKQSELGFIAEHLVHMCQSQKTFPKRKTINDGRAMGIEKFPILRHKEKRGKETTEEKKCKQPEGELLLTAVRKSTLFYFNGAWTF